VFFCYLSASKSPGEEGLHDISRHHIGLSLGGNCEFKFFTPRWNPSLRPLRHQVSDLKIDQSEGQLDRKKPRASAIEGT
jgi:hypothetical protein